MPGTAVTKSVVANEPGGRKREEIFVDIIEKISVTFSSSVSNCIQHLNVQISSSRCFYYIIKRHKAADCVGVGIINFLLIS